MRTMQSLQESLQLDLEGKLEARGTIMLHQKQIMRTHKF